MDWPVPIGSALLVNQAERSSTEHKGSANVPVIEFGLAFGAGKFTYRGHTERLTGKPLQILKALWEAKDHTLTRDALREKIWPESLPENNTIDSTVLRARNAMRKALVAVHGKCENDPIKGQDKGAPYAWELCLPE
jgi:DNA-binding response OmpR family regulator